MSKVFIVGQAYHMPAHAWDFQGVFSSEALAVAACTHPNYFVGPAELDEQLPHELMEWAGAYYPHQTKPEGEQP